LSACIVAKMFRTAEETMAARVVLKMVEKETNDKT
jgi:hypothetical protein